ncbi:MAG TPA: HAD family hydrolase [Chitinophagaceae bacterium]|nr:HAD family hydrolase [Chitinophagaceae bacterium]
MSLSNTDSIIFDLDGTLWDASAACVMAWNETFDQTGNQGQTLTEDFVRSVSGLRVEKIFSDYLSFIPKNKYEEVLETYKQKEIIFIEKYGGKLFPETKRVLTEMSAKYKLFVVSNCLKGYIESFISFHKLENIFTDFESAGNTGLPKSDNIKLIIKRNSLKNPVYVGDTEWDQEAAKAANIPFIHATYGFRTVEGAEFEIDSLSELEEILK